MIIKGKFKLTRHNIFVHIRRYFIAITCKYRIERAGLVDCFPVGADANKDKIQNEEQCAGNRD